MAFPAASTLSVNKVNKSHDTSIWYGWVDCFLLSLLRCDYHGVTYPITVNNKSRLSNVDNYPTAMPCSIDTSVLNIHQHSRTCRCAQAHETNADKQQDIPKEL